MGVLSVSISVSASQKKKKRKGGEMEGNKAGCQTIFGWRAVETKLIFGANSL